MWANIRSRIINIIINSGVFFFIVQEKRGENYLFNYGLGTDALNTISRLEKKGWNFIFFIENATTRIRTEMR